MQWASILDRLNINRVHIVGVEPLLYPEFDELMHLIKTNHRFIYITTNGWLANKWQDTIVEYVDLISISIDGIGKTHDTIRGVRGAFNRAMNAVDDMKAAKKKVRVSCVICPDNIDDLPEFHTLLTNKNVPVVYNHYNYIHSKSCQDRCQPTNMGYDPADVNIDSLWMFICKHPDAKFIPMISSRKSLVKYYQNPPISTIPKPCPIIKKILNKTHYVIAPNGDYIISVRCWMTPILGNALNGPPDIEILKECENNVVYMPPQCQRLCCAGLVV